MQRSFSAYLWDVVLACDEIREHCGDLDFAAYCADSKTRRAVERNLEIVGEALNQARRHYPERLAHMGDLAAVVAFRNRLAHDYAGLDQATMWTTVKTSIPQLRDTVERLLQEPGRER